MELTNGFIEPEKTVRIVPEQNGMAFRRSFYSKEKRQKDLKFFGETTEENHENSIKLENYKAYVRDAASNGDVSFSSYLMVGSDDMPTSTLKECLDVASPPIASCKKLNTSFELGAQDYEYSAQSRPKPIESSFIGSATKSALGNALVESKSPYQYGHGENQMGISNGSGSFVRDLQKKKSIGKRTPALGRHMTDSEISIFEAKRYFSGQEEKKSVADKSKSTENVQRPIDNPKGKMDEKNRGFVVHEKSNNLHASRPKPNYFSSMDVSHGFRSTSFRGVTTPTTSSEASWNSHSGLLSNFARVSGTPPIHKLPSSELKRATGKWCIPGFGCKCPCSGKKSVEIDDTLTETRRASSALNSLHSSSLNSPLGSIKSRYPDKMNLCKSSEKHQSSVSVMDGDQSDRDVNETTVGIKVKALPNPLNSVDNSQFKPDPKTDLQHRTDARKFGEVIPAPHEFEERHCQRRIIGTNSSIKEDVFSFPILQDNDPSSVKSSLKSEEKRMRSLQVLAGSAFHGIPNDDSMEEISKSDLHSRLMRFSLDKEKKNLIINHAAMSVNTPSKFDGEQFRKKAEGLKYNHENDGENNKHDAESDSSSDLFEIESFSTQGTGYPFYNRRKDSIEISCHRDDISSIQSSYSPTEVGFNRRENSFQFTSIEESVPPSAISSCYEPSEASVDWSVTTGDTLMDKTSLGNFPSHLEGLKKMNKHSISGNFKENTYKEGNSNSNSNSKRSSGMLGCGCKTAVNVAETNSYPIIHNQQRRAAACQRSHSMPISRVKFQGEGRVADLNASAAFKDQMHNI